MRFIFTITALLSCQFLFGQALLEDFEGFGIDQDSFINKTDDNNGFIISGASLPNTFDEEFQAWTGWALSSMRDTTTAGFLNQYSAIPGSGVDGSDTYAVSYHYIPNHFYKDVFVDAFSEIKGMYVTNGTYPYLSMKNGDAFAKKFGGADGNDPDFFLLTIKAYDAEGGAIVDSIDFYLADFRFEDNSLDYIVEEWTYVDLSSFGDAQYFTFTMSSSDVGMFGVNTPTYFCMDNLEFDFFSSTEETDISEQVSVYPNPVNDVVNISLTNQDLVSLGLYNAAGVLISETKDYQIDMSSLSQGVYFLDVRTNIGSSIKRILKK